MKQDIANNKPSNPVVFVLCMTYNHENYIEDALNGFVMQKTNFPIVVSVIDDASTDNNVRVITDYLQRVCDSECMNSTIEEYGKVIDATPSNNPNCLLHVILLNENHYCKKTKRPYYVQYEENAKYVAMCEGDDYWTDPLKLQKQVDFMEANPEYSICFHKVNTLIQATGEIKEEFLIRNMLGKSTIFDLAEGNYIHTPSVLYRKYPSVFEKYQRLSPCLPGDYVMWMLLAEKGDIYKFDKAMAVYRYGSGSWESLSIVKRYIYTMATLNKLSLFFDDTVKTILLKQIRERQSDLLQVIEEKDSKLNVMLHSNAYRIGKLFLKPFKLIKKLLYL